MITRTFALDVLERAAWTFLQAFLGVFVSVSALPVHLADWKTLAGSAFGAGVAAVVSLIKSIVAGLNGGSASTSKAVATAQATTVGAHSVTVLTGPPAVLDTTAEVLPAP